MGGSGLLTGWVGMGVLIGLVGGNGCTDPVDWWSGVDVLNG